MEQYLQMVHKVDLDTFTMETIGKVEDLQEVDQSTSLLTKLQDITEEAWLQQVELEPELEVELVVMVQLQSIK